MTIEESDAGAVVRGLWERIDARDWDGAARLLHEDFECEWPHSGERIRGRDNFIEMNRHFPEPWSIRLLRIVAQGDQAVSELEASAAGEAEYALSFFTVHQGRIAHLREYWVPRGFQQPTAWRARWVESPLAPSDLEGSPRFSRPGRSACV
jgi:ketosteroid isomerase-like protein